jgi:hypothetical protein
MRADDLILILARRAQRRGDKLAEVEGFHRKLLQEAKEAERAARAELRLLRSEVRALRTSTAEHTRRAAEAESRARIAEAALRAMKGSES